MLVLTLASCKAAEGEKSAFPVWDGNGDKRAHRELVSLLCSSVRELHSAVAGNFCPLENFAPTQHLVFQMALQC